MNETAWPLSNLMKARRDSKSLMGKVNLGVDPDRELVQRSQAGEAGAFDALLMRHFARTRSLIFQLVGPQRVDDVTQEAFLLAYRKLEGFRSEAKFSTWLTRIAVNLCRSEWRRRKRAPEVSFDALSEEAILKEGHGNTKDASDAMIGCERGERIDREITALPERLRITFVLRYIEGHSPREIAVVLRCREGTVRSRLFNARQILMVRLKELVE